MKVRMNGYKIAAIDMKNSIESQTGMSVSSSSAFHVKFKGNQMAKAIFEHKMASNDGDFYMNFTLEGWFLLEGVETPDDKKKVHISCYDQMFPYANQLASQLAQNSGIMGVFIQKLDIDINSIEFENSKEHEAREREEEESKMIEFPADPSTMN